MCSCSYFELAKKYHPDTNKDDPKAKGLFQEASEAYEALNDPEKRGLYDQYGHAAVDGSMGGGGGGGGGGGFPGGGDPFDIFRQAFGQQATGGMGGGGGMHFEFRQGGMGGQNVDMDDLLKDFFGGGGQGRPRGPRRGQDVQVRLQLTLLEAVKGCAKQIDVPKIGPDGRVHRGSGVTTVPVAVPAGIRQGMTMRVAGEGAEGEPGAPRGNLMVQLDVLGDDYFQMDGADVHIELPLRRVVVVVVVVAVRARQRVPFTPLVQFTRAQEQSGGEGVCSRHTCYARVTLLRTTD